MTDTVIKNFSRREFLVKTTSSVAGLTLGFFIPGIVVSAETQPVFKPEFSNDEFIPNAFLKIDIDNTIRFFVKHLEMGQGTYTGLTTIVADELDASWDQMVPVGAPADAARFNNSFWGQTQGTGGSSGIANSYMQLRQAGAAAKHMLIAAAAQKWQVPAAEIGVNQGIIKHRQSTKKAHFGELAKLAAKQSVPSNLRLKSSEEFVYIGKNFPRKDHGKNDGTAIFTQDVKLPGMLTAVIAHPPRFGGKVKSFNADQARQMSRVVDVFAIPQGVVVLAKDFWSAKKGREALEVEWDDSNAMMQSSDEILMDYKKLATKPGVIANQKGSLSTGFESAKEIVELDYEFPYLAHATMEPMDCVVTVEADGVSIKNGAQLQSGDQMSVAAALNLKPEQVKIDTLFAGGSFGRRANPVADYVVEAALIAAKAGKNVPVKLVWTREDDMRAGYYRPMYVHKLKAGIDNKGRIVAWHHRIVGQSILKGTPFEAFIQNGIDSSSIEGAQHLPYAMSNMQVELHTTDVSVPVLWWRSVGSTHTAFSTETMIDELAHLAGVDPVQYRLRMMQDHPRETQVLKKVAELSGWNKPLAKNHARGVALHKSFGSYVAQVAEVSLQTDGHIRVDKIYCTVDCGIAVNPDIVKAQMEGGIGYGLSPTLMSRISLEQGKVKESNFHDYQVLRMDKMPKIEVEIINSRENPTGVGEPGTPVVGPAVANAIFALTKKRITQLPIGDQAIV